MSKIEILLTNPGFKPAVYAVQYYCDKPDHFRIIERVSQDILDDNGNVVFTHDYGPWIQTNAVNRDGLDDLINVIHKGNKGSVGRTLGRVNRILALA